VSVVKNMNAALDLIAAELERLRLLKEFELKARIEYSPDPWVRPDDATEE
jgi:hypothetical protein